MEQNLKIVLENIMPDQLNIFGEYYQIYLHLILYIKIDRFFVILTGG